jgi:hypothetical protein
MWWFSDQLDSVACSGGLGLLGLLGLLRVACLSRVSWRENSSFDYWKAGFEQGISFTSHQIWYICLLFLYSFVSSSNYVSIIILFLFYICRQSIHYLSPAVSKVFSTVWHIWSFIFIVKYRTCQKPRRKRSSWRASPLSILTNGFISIYDSLVISIYLPLMYLSNARIRW